jgi:hypothetical protein
VARVPKSTIAAQTPAGRARVLKHLHELVAALDHRVPHVERQGEAAIARDAAALRKKALIRIAELEAED